MEVLVLFFLIVFLKCIYQIHRNSSNCCKGSIQKMFPSQIWKFQKSNRPRPNTTWQFCQQITVSRAHEDKSLQEEALLLLSRNWMALAWIFIMKILYQCSQMTTGIRYYAGMASYVTLIREMFATTSSFQKPLLPVHHRWNPKQKEPPF